MAYKDREEEEKKAKEEEEKKKKAKENREASKKLYTFAAVALIAWGLLDKTNQYAKDFVYIGVAFGLLALIYFAQDSGWIDKLPKNSMLRYIFGNKGAEAKDQQKKIEPKKK